MSECCVCDGENSDDFTSQSTVRLRPNRSSSIPAHSMYQCRSLKTFEARSQLVIRRWLPVIVVL